MSFRKTKSWHLQGNLPANWAKKKKRHLTQIFQKKILLVFKKKVLGDSSMTRNTIQALLPTLSLLPDDIFFYFT